MRLEFTPKELWLRAEGKYRELNRLLDDRIKAAMTSLPPPPFGKLWDVPTGWRQWVDLLDRNENGLYTVNVHFVLIEDPLARRRLRKSMRLRWAAYR